MIRQSKYHLLSAGKLECVLLCNCFSHFSFLWIVALPLSYLLDQRRILFWNRMMRSDNILRTLSHSMRNTAMAVGSVYNVDLLPMSHTGVKNAVRSSFASLVHNVLAL